MGSVESHCNVSFILCDVQSHKTVSINGNIGKKEKKSGVRWVGGGGGGIEPMSPSAGNR